MGTRRVETLSVWFSTESSQAHQIGTPIWPPATASPDSNRGPSIAPWALPGRRTCAQSGDLPEAREGAQFPRISALSRGSAGFFNSNSLTAGDPS